MISADLGKQLENYVKKLVDGGRYSSKSEVLREGIRLVQEREMRLLILDQAINKGIEDAEAGNTKSANSVFDDLEHKYQLMLKKNN